MKITMSPHNKSVQDAAQQYFSNINPIASRIYSDFEETKNSYECVWNTLSFEEQSQILNECIIKPEVTLQYSLKSSEKSDKTPTSESFAHKRVIDENVSYRDEHSAPFSFKTLSQVDLRLFGSDPSKQNHVTPKQVPPKLVPLKLVPPKAVPPKPVPPKMQAIQRVTRLLGRSEAAGVRLSSDEMQALVSTAPATISDDSASPCVPKTGLDFLDNW